MYSESVTGELSHQDSAREGSVAYGGKWNAVYLHMEEGLVGADPRHKCHHRAPHCILDVDHGLMLQRRDMIAKPAGEQDLVIELMLRGHICSELLSEGHRGREIGNDCPNASREIEALLFEQRVAKIEENGARSWWLSIHVKYAAG
jgi:hypothetical protein